MLITDHTKLVRRASDIITISNRLRPYHVRLHITNKCNLTCNFCLHSDRARDKEFSYTGLVELTEKLMISGCKAVTLTGGGEPLMHPEIEKVIELLANNWMDVGLETNGYLLGSISKQSLRRLSWCSITVSDDSDVNSLLDVLHQEASQIRACSFNYVVTEGFKPEQLAKVLKAAERMSFERITVVSDMTDLPNVPSMHDVRQYAIEEGAPLDRATFHGYKMYSQGDRRCLVSLVKPTIDADGLIYPCNTRRVSDSADDILSRYNKQSYYDGSNCTQCYHSNHNKTLEKITGTLAHEEFV